MYQHLTPAQILCPSFSVGDLVTVISLSGVVCTHSRNALSAKYICFFTDIEKIHTENESLFSNYLLLSNISTLIKKENIKCVYILHIKNAPYNEINQW